MDRKRSACEVVSEEEFDKKLLEAVDTAFSCLGDSGRKALYFQLDKRFSVGQKEITKNLGSFRHGLEVFFGPGAHVLEDMIAEDLYGILGLPWKNHRSWNLTRYIEDVREKCRIKQKTANLRK